MLDEWQLSGSQRRQCRFVEIVDIDRQPSLGKSKHKRNADVAGAAHDCNVGALRTPRIRRRRFGRCNIQLVPLSPKCAPILSNWGGPPLASRKQIIWTDFQLLS